MLQALVNRAQHAIDTVVSRFITRAVVAVPFVIAVAFAVAAATVKLSEAYGSATAYVVLAAVFVVVGAIAAVTTTNATSEVAGEAVADTASSVTDKDVSSSQDPLSSFADPAMLLSALGTAGPVMLPKLIRGISRNLPLIIGVIIVAYLLFSEARKSEGMSSASA